MMSNSDQLAISIDAKKGRIRINKKTLSAIGYPEYILLLVNPEDCTLAILRSNQDDQRAYHLPIARYNEKQCFEIHSKALIQNLQSMCDDWVGDYSYRIYGEVVKNEWIAQFCISEATPTDGIRG